MKTWNHLYRAAAGLLLLSIFSFVASSATAQKVTLLASQNFSGSFPPTGWTNAGGFHQSANGDGGSGGSSYGSAWDDVWGYSAVPLSTPSENASSYAVAADSVWVDYDFFWEYDEYDAAGYGDDTYQLKANNSDVLVSGTQASLYTYYAPTDGNYSLIQTSSADWKHYHILIPVADRTSSMTINFSCNYGWGCSDFAVTNVTITASSTPPGALSLLPKSLNFGTATPNSPDTLYATAYGLGIAPLHIQGLGISGSSAFSIISGKQAGDSIMPGAHAQFGIQFLPLSGGALTGSFTLVTDGADSGTQSVSLTGFGAVPDVSYGVTNLFHHTNVMLSDTSQMEYVPVTSTGGGPLHFFSISFIGLNADNYIVSRMPQNPLPVDVTDSIGIQFAPTLEGRPDASLVINTDATNKPWDTVQLFGVGVLPHLLVTVPPPGSGNTVNFDSVAIGDSACQQIMLQNVGSDTLQIVKQLVTYGDYDFTFHPLTGADTMILPGDSIFATVCFKPLRSGTRLATLRFFTNIPLTYEKPRRDTSEFDIQVTGIGVPYGQLSLLGSLNDTVVVGNTKCLTDTLKNNGQTDLTVNSVTLAPKTANFAITSAQPPFTIAAGRSLDVSLCFTPKARGTETDTLIIAGTTSQKAVIDTVILTGVGVVECVSADSMITFGTAGLTPVDSVATSCITVTNCGDVATTYTASLPSGTVYTLVPPLISAVVPAGGTAQFCVTFTPTAVGAANGSVTITGGPNAATTLLGGVGAGVAAMASGTLATPVADGQCQSFNVTITDTGNVAWTPGTGMISGPNAADFTITTQATPAMIAPGGTATVTINFCPTIQGTESMTLTFPNESPVPVAGAFSYTTSAVGAASGVTPQAEQDGFTLGASYPNPTSGLTDITFTLPEEARVTLRVLDETGKIVNSEVTNVSYAAGQQSVRLDLGTLANGSYVYQLIATGADGQSVTLSKKLTLEK
ncbi:MAG TPA: choice-of-anchor D domain-containing protein [Candidatus Kapabacteria bacterium]|nr:choice-of-anchor D domain-containing protein [Candidatus Kapabacteria bacterium]